MGLGHTATLRTLYQIGHIVTHADPICRYLRWKDEYPFFIANIASFGLDRLFSEEKVNQITSFSLPLTALDDQTCPLLTEKTQIHERLRCALLELQAVCVKGAFRSTSCTYLSLPPPLALPKRYTAVLIPPRRSCPRRHTDYAVSVVPDADPSQPEGRLLVFTTWKGLGDGSSNDRFWKSHQMSAPPEGRIYGFGYMRWFFDKLDSFNDITYRVDAEEIHQCVALARSKWRNECVGVAGPSS
jgi:hypothetical protein